VERRRKLEQVATYLEHAAREIGGPAGAWIFLLGDLKGDILGYVEPRDALHAIDFLHKLALVLRKALDSLGGVGVIPAEMPISAIMVAVRAQTGRPHYDEMATLIGAAYGKPAFSADDLKMLMHRRRR
jgi:hypothetical protein